MSPPIAPADPETVARHKRIGLLILLAKAFVLAAALAFIVWRRRHGGG